jgi:disabled family protein 2
MRTIQEDSVKENGSVVSSEKSAQHPSDVIADLLDLEFELNSIQRGINQMQRITPSDPFGPSTSKEDPFGSVPFGDSFNPDTMFPSSKTTKSTPIGILPPPPSVKDTSRSSDPFHVPPPARHPHRRSAARPEHYSSETVKPQPAAASQLITAPTTQQEKHWFDQETESLFDEGELITPPIGATTTTTTTTTISTVSSVTPKTDQVCHTLPSTCISPLGLVLRLFSNFSHFFWL